MMGKYIFLNLCKGEEEKLIVGHVQTGQGGLLVKLLRQDGENFFSSSQMPRQKKLECLFLKILSSQVLKFEGKARANPIVGPFRCFLLG
jgi:hypothetical protein